MPRQLKRVSKVTSPINIILLGDPAAGKATQSALLVKKYQLYDFDMGKELNERRVKNKKLDAVLQGNTDKGNLTPTQIVRKIHREVILKTPKTQGVLFDGTPKMLGEARLIYKLLKEIKRHDPVVIYLSIPLSETVKRMNDRIGYFSGKFGKRADDSDAALKNRVRYYRKNISQVVAFFSSKYKYKRVSGLGSVAEVRQRIAKAIKELSK
jgi:adenylate kinase